ncbi:MAG: hypothetical protein R2705_06030 [Ilumatobacteraceae bacterium]
MDRGAVAVVEVLEELVEGPDPLDEPALEQPPLVGWDHPGNEVEWEGSFGALLVAVDRERDALGLEDGVLLPLAPMELLGRETVEPVDELDVRIAYPTVIGDDLVEEVVSLAMPFEQPHVPTFRQSVDAEFGHRCLSCAAFQIPARSVEAATEILRQRWDGDANRSGSTTPNPSTRPEAGRYDRSAPRRGSRRRTRTAACPRRPGRTWW